MMKKIIGILVVIMMFMATGEKVNAATKHSVDEAISWVKSLEGQVYDYDNDEGAQCVDLIKGYYNYLGVTPVGGNGCDYATNAVPSGWQRIKGGVPQKGDILVYTGGYGHVAIYEGGTILWHGRFGGVGKVQKTTSIKYNGLTNTYWGLIRPNWDSEVPSISNVIVSEVTETGYTVTCTAADNMGISKVCFPTWTDANGQDDLALNWWDTTVAEAVSGNTYAYRVNRSDHNNESGRYTTHIYAYDLNGNYVSTGVTVEVYDVDHGITSEFPLVDNAIYKIKNVSSGKLISIPMASNENSVLLHQWEEVFVNWQYWKAVKHDDGYSFVSVHNGKAMDVYSGTVNAGERLTQFDYNASAAQRFKLIHRGNGQYSMHTVCSDMALDVNGGTSDNGVEIMQYFYFGSGNQLWSFELVDSEKPVISDVVIDNVTIEGFDVTCTVTDNVGIDKVCFPVWTDANGQDDLNQDWINATKATNVSGNTYSYNVNITEHNNESGLYVIHIYGFDTSGNQAFSGWTVEVPKKVSFITLNKTALQLTAGATSQLTATVSPSDAGNKKVNWKSSNTSVATVDSTGKVTAVGAGTATITATAADGSGVKATCAVTVVSNLSITAQPANVTITEGGNATFKVTATGSNLTYQWQFKNASATYWTDSTMTGAKTNSITVKATTARNGYQYRCVVKDGSGNKVTSNAAKLTVNRAISITGQPTSASVNEGANATFKVTATGSNLTYQWQFKNASATYWSDSTMTGSKTNSITVKGTTARNGYQYRCVVKDGNGNKVTSNAAKLTVTKGVQIKSQPATQTVMEGTNVTFKVTASGSGLTYQWQFKNATSDYWSNSSMAGSNTNSITVKATMARNGYQYRCVVKDSNGNKVTSNAAMLVVIQGVQITSQPASNTVTAGNYATFKVTASGSGLTYQWQFRNATSDYWSNSGMAGSNTNSITVQGTAARNGYQYRCVVKDSNGNKVTSNAAKLTVK